MKKTKKVLDASDELYEAYDERIVLFRDEQPEWCRNWCDHPFVLWSNCKKYGGDTKWDPCLKRRVEVDSPFMEILDEDGNPTGEHELREGVVAFPVSVYDHSGLSYSLGGGLGFPDYRWDVTPNALWLWTDKDNWEKMYGNGTWEKAKDDKELLLAEAKREVREMNLDERGMWFFWRHEKKRKWTKTYEDGETVDGHDWKTVDSECGYLTDSVEEIDFPRFDEIPVFAGKDTWFEGDEYSV